MPPTPRPKPPARRTRRIGGSGGKTTYTPPRWRFDDLLIGLGADELVAFKLEKRGYPRVPTNSVTGWRLRNSIPPFWLPIVIQLGLDEKLIKRIEDLRVP